MEYRLNSIKPTEIKIETTKNNITKRMKRVCAYCGKEGSLTKEHIWPLSIIQRSFIKSMRFSQRANKVFSADLTIADVCALCNNGNLSLLDSYLCKLYDKYFNEFAEKISTITFEYDYNNLLRALLKISFNTARANKNLTDTKLLERHKDFVLNGGEPPENFILFLDLIPPTLNGNEKVYPHSARSGSILFRMKVDWARIRLVSINSYYFYIIIIDSQPHSIERTEAEKFISNVSGTLISSNKSKINLTTNNKIDTYDIHSPHFDMNSELYENYKKK